ncbi:hypothetical protein PR003_g29420 [Phytophthora rubi]|uniref:Uncharacterized protein n=1 Tax=Phytophthora rubi TaxID=129364 RepID=A0A6A4BMF3_9STRA|nr:hypothetical protein PR003_g29420 [Phytophthora rubi]
MNLRGVDRNKNFGPDAWRAHREGSTAGEASHYGTCRSGGIVLILRFVPLGKSPATSSSGGSSIAGVDASPAWKPASHIRTATTTSCSDSSNSSIAGRGTTRWNWCKPRLEGSRASHRRTATTTSSGSGSSSSSSSSSSIAD